MVSPDFGRRDRSGDHAISLVSKESGNQGIRESGDQGIRGSGDQGIRGYFENQ